MKGPTIDVSAHKDGTDSLSLDHMLVSHFDIYGGCVGDILMQEVAHASEMMRCPAVHEPFKAMSMVGFQHIGGGSHTYHSEQVMGRCTLCGGKTRGKLGHGEGAWWQGFKWSKGSHVCSTLRLFRFSHSHMSPASLLILVATVIAVVIANLIAS